MMNDEDQEIYNILWRSGHRKMAREYLYLLRRRAFIDKLQRKWVKRVQALSDEMKVAQLNYELEKWNDSAD